MIEQIVDLVGGHFHYAHHVQDEAGIDVAAAGAHDEAFERREAHGGVDAFSIADRAQSLIHFRDGT